MSLGLPPILPGEPLWHWLYKHPTGKCARQYFLLREMVPACGFHTAIPPQPP